MQAFVAVANDKSFSAAARSLGISKVLVSKYVGQLEDELGVRLLHRTTRKVSLTTTGEAYLEPCAALIEEFELLQGSVQELNHSPRGRLRISAPATYGEMQLLPIVERFNQQYPDIAIELDLTDRYVDLVEEGYDLAVRIGQLEDSSLIARRICDMPSWLCASPEYLQQHGKPAHPSELQHHQLLVDSNYRGGKQWQLLHADLGTEMVTVNASLRINSARAIRDLMLQHKGIGSCPEFAVEQQLRDGSLVAAIEGWHPPTTALYVMYPNRRHLSAKVRLFIETLQQACNPSEPDS